MRLSNEQALLMSDALGENDGESRSAAGRKTP
jgi:hypothetical protein